MLRKSRSVCSASTMHGMARLPGGDNEGSVNFHREYTPQPSHAMFASLHHDILKLYLEILFQGTNLDVLTEVITTQAEVSELKAEWSGPAEGVVLEAQTHKQKGYTQKPSSLCMIIGVFRLHCFVTAEAVDIGDPPFLAYDISNVIALVFSLPVSISSSLSKMPIYSFVGQERFRSEPANSAMRWNFLASSPHLFLVK